MNAVSRYAAHAARAFLLALQYFTRVPIPKPLVEWTGFSAPLQRASLAHFPGIGWLVAGVAIACYTAVVHALPASSTVPLAAAVLSTIATVLLTGAMHEDGLADTADGLGAGDSREAALAVMKDSHAGTWGVMALVFVLIAKVALLGAIGYVAGWRGAAGALLAGHVLSRGLALVIVATLPNVGSVGVSKSIGLASQVNGAGMAIAAAWCLPALVITAAITTVWMMLAGLLLAVATLFAMRSLFAHRLQGFTGDCLGATQQLCEVAFLFGMVMASRGLA